MTRINIKKLKNKIGETVTIAGFAQTVRDQNKIAFVIVRDVTGTVQCVFLKDTPEALEIAKSLSTESVIQVVGLVKESSQAKEGYEIEAKEILVLSVANPELPIPVVTEKSGGETEMTTRFDYRWIDMRKPEKTQIFQLWTALERGLRKYYTDNEWTQVYTPAFMSTASETGADVFEVKYFDRKAYLAQSPQFYKQMALAGGLEKVFMVGPVFRAEHSFTTRHMTEFTGWDFEFAYINNHHDVMDAEEGMLVAAFEEAKKALPELDITVPSRPFPRITLADAKAKTAAAGVSDEDDPYDLSPEEERKIAEIVREEHGHDFVFITDWHIKKRAFYHMRYEDKPELTKSFDLLYRGLEITTGAQREHRIDILEKQAVEKGMKLEELKDYLDFFRWGCPPHGGGGVGPSRLVMQMLGLPNVREATYLPRDVKRLNP